jgi:hypothetical protein
MSNAIIKQQGDSPVVADNIWEFRLGGVSFILGVLAGALVTAAVGRLAKADATPKPPTPHDWPINFAHRGGAKVVPENTVEGFREGFALGGGVVECDVHASAEGTIFVIHDAVVDRTTNGTGSVAEKTVAELQNLDAGYRFSQDGGTTFPWRAKGVKIPTSKVAGPALRRPYSVRSRRQGRWNAPWLSQMIGGPFAASAESVKERSPLPPPLWSCCVIGFFTCCIWAVFTIRRFRLSSLRRNTRELSP